jgi:hypothetical protein
MDAQSTTIELAELNHLEADELESDLRAAGLAPASGLEIRRVDGGLDGRAGAHGEPFTLLAIMALGQVALTGLAVYLAKGRQNSKQKIRLRHRKPDGEELEFELEVDVSSEEAIRADLMKQIGALHIPLPKDLLAGGAHG